MHMRRDELTTTFSALADPTRRAILTRLLDGEATLGQLAEPFSISLQAVSKHVGVLERAGLIERRRSAQQRRARLRTAPLEEATQWLAGYRRLWEASFDSLEERVKEGGDAGAG